VGQRVEKAGVGAQFHLHDGPPLQQGVCPTNRVTNLQVRFFTDANQVFVFLFLIFIQLGLLFNLYYRNAAI
jgi:hypothetical protein